MVLSTGDLTFTIFIAAILLFAVVSNIFVITVVLRTPRMRNVTNLLICNLATSDIILGGFVSPQHLHDLSHEENFHEGFFLCKLINAFPILCIVSSIYSLVFISIERKRSIVNSLQTQLTTKTCKKIVPAIWLWAITLATPTMIEYDVREVSTGNKTFTSCRSFWPMTYSLMNGIILLLLAYLIPLIVMCYNYFHIISFVLKRRRSVGSSTGGNSGENNDFGDDDDGRSRKPTLNKQKTTSVLFKKRMKIVIMLIIVAVLFAISWLPYFVSLTISKATGEDSSENTSSFLNLLRISLAAFSTGYNVILYVIFNNNFRNGFKQLLCCCIKRKSKIRSFENTATNLPMISTVQTNA